MFDISIIKLDNNSKILNIQNYKYGKLVETLHPNTNNIKNIILKAPLDTSKKNYAIGDTNFTIIPIAIPK